MTTFSDDGGDEHRLDIHTTSSMPLPRPPTRRQRGETLLDSLSPDEQPPEQFSYRRFSFSIENYTALRKNHRRLITVFNWMFPNPLMVTARAMKKAGLKGERLRGGMVFRDGVEGRLVGRHPETGTPVVAWNQGAYASMCESFDAENAARIVAWKTNSERLQLTSQTNMRYALLLDQGLRLLSVGTGLLVPLAMLGMVTTFSPEFGGFMLVPFLLSSLMGGILIALPMLLMAGITILLLIRMGANVAGVMVGLQALRANQQATVTDEAGHLSAMEIISAMQATPHTEQQRAAIAANAVNTVS